MAIFAKWSIALVVTALLVGSFIYMFQTQEGWKAGETALTSEIENAEVQLDELRMQEARTQKELSLEGQEREALSEKLTATVEGEK